MKAKVVIDLVLASAFVFSAVGHAAPPATKYQSTLTDNTSGSATPSVHVLKSSKIQVKVSTGNICFALKLKGVGVIPGDAPANNAGNSILIQVNVNGGNRNVSRSFDLANGAVTPTTAKQCISNTSTADWGVSLTAGQPVEIKRVQLFYGADADPFAVAGVTAK